MISARLEGGVVEGGGDYKEQEGALHGTEEEKPKDPGNGWRGGGGGVESWNGGNSK